MEVHWHRKPVQCVAIARQIALHLFRPSGSMQCISRAESGRNFILLPLRSRRAFARQEEEPEQLVEEKAREAVQEAPLPWRALEAIRDARVLLPLLNPFISAQTY